MSETKKHTHWLYGHGPNKELDFNIYVESETKCKECIHRHVCNYNMAKRCVNRTFATSSATGCGGCIHRYTRWDKDHVPCFQCNDFLRDRAAEQFTIDVKYKRPLVGEYNPAISKCPNCDRDMPQNTVFDHIIGFADGNGNDDFAMVECPHCFTKWHFHTRLNRDGGFYYYFLLSIYSNKNIHFK